MMNDKKSPVQKFLEGKGFYIALASVWRVPAQRPGWR